MVVIVFVVASASGWLIKIKQHLTIKKKRLVS